MLRHLFIQNYALIDTLDIELEEGFSVITGETGAGKSILLGAIGLLLGQRADSKAIRTDAQRCVIEATFDLSNYQLESLFEDIDVDYDGTECVIRRELTAAGKSRAFVNDTPVGLTQLRQLGDCLIDIHSQHQNLLLANEDFQLNILDILAENQKELAEYVESYKEFKRIEKQLEETKKEAEKQQSEQDYLSFQLTQLEEANLQEGEDEELEEELQTLEHAEEIKTALYQANDLLQNESHSILQMLRTAGHALDGISHMLSSASELAERIESCRIELKDVAEELEGEAENIEYNPNRQAFVEERLSTIYDLERKHHVETLSELISIRNELTEKLNHIANSEEEILQLETTLKNIKEKVLSKADKLSRKRAKAALQMEKQMCNTLIPLGMPNIQFKVEIVKRNDPDASGMDQVTFLFCANKNMALQPISHVASGGEIARVMLSLKALVSGAINMPTIIFDEIDTGVSGQIAERMALIMKEMGENNGRQVISITHLPQIAAMGSHHYRVYKEDNESTTNSHIVRLNDAERVEEIAHMLSGSNLTEAAINNARTLLNK